jgi:hypothetical protein
MLFLSKIKLYFQSFLIGHLVWYSRLFYRSGSNFTGKNRRSGDFRIGCNIGHIFWIVSDRAFISHMSVHLWQDLSNGTKIFDLVTLTLKFYPLFKNLNIGNIFWMVSDRALIFHMYVPYDKTFLLVPKYLTL